MSDNTILDDDFFRAQLKKFGERAFIIEKFQNGKEEIAKWGAAYFFMLLQGKQIFIDKNQIYSFDEIKNKIRLLAIYQKQLDSLMEILIREKLIFSPMENCYQLKSQIELSLAKLFDDKRSLIQSYPELQTNIDFLHSTLEHYLQILAGEEIFLNLLFPNGSFQQLIELYKNNPIAKYYNQIAAKTIELVVNYFLARKKQNINILEIGAGIGSTTEQLLPNLNGEKVSYAYTDVSNAFLAYAQKEFNQYKNILHFAKYDINKSAYEQGFQENFYDIIFSTNAIHNAKSIEKTLLELNALLRPGGVLILCEGIKRSDYSTFIYGLTSGWWIFNDAYWRINNSPLIDVASWEKLFTLTSFKLNFSVNSLLTTDSILDHDILVAEKIK